jgi:8-amino-7-oxononanoate synthase
MLKTFLENHLADWDAKGLRRRARTIEGPQGREVVIDGRKLLNFCSNDYLGLAGDQRLCEAAKACMEEEGFGAGASRLVCGNLSAHERLEETMARFKGTERCLVFSTGYMANVGILSGLFGRGDWIFSDRLNHASIIDGIILSQAHFKRYPHGDMEALEDMLRLAPSGAKKVIVTDSVFSMDGDIAPLDRIVALAQKYECLVMVDEAHGLGVLGQGGRGAVEHFDLEGKVDIQMGTFSKAAGSFGAYCCGPADLIEFLINRARSFIYTTGLPPSVAAASLKGIEIIKEEPERRRRLWDNTDVLLRGLKQMGFDTLVSRTPIIPIIIGESRVAVEFSQKLFEAGIFVSAIRPPTVPQNTARLRLTVTATHTPDDLQQLLGEL